MIKITPIEKLENNNEKRREHDNIIDKIFDMSESNIERVNALNAYYSENGENTVELINKLCDMYLLSGTRLLENFLMEICDTSKISSMLKLMTVKSLISFREKFVPNDEETENDDSEITRANENNERRRLNGYKILNGITKNMGDVSTPQQIDAIFCLMEAPEYKNESMNRFEKFLANHDISCDYRYKTILQLENRDGRCERNITDRDFFLRRSMLFFIRDNKNMTMYRILAGQYTLQNLHKYISSNERECVQNVLLVVAEDTELDFNIRADAADTLLSVGDENCVMRAREIIAMLSFAMGQRRTLFDNAQNVHVTEIEDSVIEILVAIIDTPLAMTESDECITFEFVRNKIMSNFVLKKKRICEDSDCKHKKCKICEECVITEKNSCCDDECEKVLNKKTKVDLSLNRIAIDRVLYSRLSITLMGILLRVWSYISRHESRDEMEKRLLEELYDMSGTCSTGFASRLINVLSGFGEFNIRISWRDQIVANFSGRLNALARKIDAIDSEYFTNESHISDITMLYIRANPSVCKIYKNLTREENVKKYLKTNRRKKLQEIVEEFKSNVLIEMAVNTSIASERQNFLKFFRTNMLKIREEMYDEFKKHMTDTDFDLWFRSAIMSYETGHTD